MNSICMQLQDISEGDLLYINTEIRDAFTKMETHLEIFDLPSGKRLWLWCDGRYRIKEPNEN